MQGSATCELRAEELSLEQSEACEKKVRRPVKREQVKTSPAVDIKKGIRFIVFLFLLDGEDFNPQNAGFSDLRAEGGGAFFGASCTCQAISYIFERDTNH